MVQEQEAEQAILLAAQVSKQPLCVYGPPGCGKSRLINLAWESRHPNLCLADCGPVSVNIDDSVDAKALVGTFRSSLTEPGRFEWVDGLLVELIQSGRWLVLEDVDRLNPDILSILPRQGDSHFRIPETSRAVPIHPNFGLIGTSTVSNTRKISRALSNWLLLECGYPKDLLAIVSESLPPMIAQLVLDSYASLISLPTLPTERKFGLHDLFRAVAGVKALLPSIKVTSQTVYVTDFQKSRIGLELVDIFANHSPFPERRQELIDAIESSLMCGSIPTDPCPAYSADETSVSIGGTTLLRRTPPSHDEGTFTLTSVHLRMLQRVARGLAHQEGILVVGDTGVGKTTSVQFLARQLGIKMHAYNFSDQTEGSDLIGGLKPVMEIEKVVAECEHLVRSTLPESSQKSGLAILDYIVAKAAKRDFQAVVKAVEKTALRAISLLEPSGAHAESVAQWKALLASCLSSGKVFRFVEGPLVTAVRTGEWILLDEINLAPPDVLRLLNGLLENQRIVIPETGEQIQMHEGFRLIGAMNPPHLGKGKRSVTDSLRSRFLEIYCEEITDRSDLMKIIHMSLERDLTVSTLAVVVPKIIDLYFKLKLELSSQLSNMEGGAPVFSLRSLTRALEFAKRLLRSPKRVAGAQSGDGTWEVVDGLKVSFSSAIDSRSEAIVVKLIDSTFATKPQKSADGVVYESEWVRVQNQWIALGDEPASTDPSKFIVTESVSRNLKKLAICLAGGKIARPPILCEGSTGAGKTSLVTFLARTSRHRLVRINNHEHTDLQDYFGQYVSQPDGGLMFQEGPLVTAVRCGHWVLLDELNLAPSEVLEALNRLLDDNRELIVPETNEVVKAHPDFVLFASQNPVTLDYAGRKTLSRAFRNRFIDVQIDELPSSELGLILSAKCTLAESTANRMLATYAELSRLRRLDRVLSGRDSALVTVRDLLRWGMRQPTTKEEIALEGYLVLAERLRSGDQKALVVRVLEDCVGVKNLPSLILAFYESESIKIYSQYDLAREFGFVRTQALDRMLALVSRAIAAGESVLAVGETGTGKTSAFQLVAALNRAQLRIINCHQHLESSDLLGAVGPVNGQLAWKDGPLIESMRAGGWMLLDEVNLADDSVVERLNSLLDVDSRAVTLAEKPKEETVLAAKEFRLLCTMNPGNDFGKKELSAALRNRFTEIWVDSVSFALPEPGDTGVSTGYSLIASMLHVGGEAAARTVCACIDFAISQLPSLNVSTRDAILWCSFVNASADVCRFDLEEAVAHGAALVLMDSLDPSSMEYRSIFSFLTKLVSPSVIEKVFNNHAWIANALEGARIDPTSFGPFPLTATATGETGSFSLNAPTSAANFGRLIRAMFGGKRPVLLHGDPGAGKSSVVSALAKFCGVNLIRINLSDQTELADILGQNIPDPMDGKKFVWKDGILLEAISRGDWVLLDELNLAPQPVLEGLNALLDHRAEIYVPAIDRLVKCPPSFRLFATQNEAQKGDGRKMLPRSFLSRFNRLRVSAMGLTDLAVAAKESMRGSELAVSQAISMIAQLGELKIAEFDWNLRDISRLLKCESLTAEVAWMILGSRIRDSSDREKAKAVIARVMGESGSDLDWIDPAQFIPSPWNRSESTDLLKVQATAVAAVTLGLRSGSHVIVTGESGSGKRSVVQLVSAMTNSPISEIRMHSQMDTSDLIGQFSQQLSDSGTEFKWVDSPLTVAVRTGGWIVLTNAHCCPPAILDRLNALIEDGGLLVIPEKGEAEVVVPHENFRLVLVTEKPNCLSHAIRNRCVEVHVTAPQSEISLFDKVRVGMTVSPAVAADKNLMVTIASRVDSARHMHQCTSLVAAGLPVESAIRFITGRAGLAPIATEDEISLLGSLHTTSPLQRQWAVVQAVSPAQRGAAVAWFLESATGCDFADRLSVAGHNVCQLDSAVWQNPLARRLAIKLLTAGKFGAVSNDFSLPNLHAISRSGSSGLDPLLARLVTSQTESSVCCFDPLTVQSEPSPAIFTGAYRQTSEGLFAALLQLAKLKSVPSAALVEMTASAIALRLSKEEVAITNELRILETVTDLLRSATDVDMTESVDVVEAQEGDVVRTNVQQILRLCGVVDIPTLIRCRAELTESDLVLAGVTRASEWTGTDVAWERIFAVLMNWISVVGDNGSKSVAVHRAVEGAKYVACGDVGAVIESFGLVHSELGRSGDLIPSVDDLVADALSSLRAVNLLTAESDVHAEKFAAVKDIESELAEATSESHVKRLCRDASALGVDDSAVVAWTSSISSCREAIVNSGIYVRPVHGRGYEKLRFLFAELMTMLADENAVRSSHCVNRLVSFVNTVSTTADYTHYRDLTRPVCFHLLRLIYGLTLAARTVFAPVVPPVPVDRDRISTPTSLVDWLTVENGLNLNVDRSSELLKSRIDESVAAMDAARAAAAEAAEADHIMQGDVHISLASLVQDNDKATADAAVNRLRRELFPDTSSKFIRSLKSMGSDSFFEEMGDDEDNAADDKAGVMEASDLDKLAISLVASSEHRSVEVAEVMREYMCAEGAKFMHKTDTGIVDSAEIIALNRLRLRAAVTHLQAKVVAPVAMEEPVPAASTEEEDEEVRHDNREMKLKLADFVKTGFAINFYSPGGGSEAVALLSKPLGATHRFLLRLKSIDEISDHPDVVSTIDVVAKALQLKADCSAVCALQTAEYVLLCVQKLEKSIPSRYLTGDASFGGSSIIPSLISVIARLRASEIASWKDLRLLRETTLSKSNAGKWFVHLWKAVGDEDIAAQESCFDLVLSWLRNSGIGQFSFRLSMLESVARLTHSRVLRHAVGVAKLWEPAVNRKIRTARSELDKEVRALTKEVSFRLGGRHYSNEMFRIDTKRSHNQLASVLRRFEESISVRVEEAVSAAGSISKPVGKNAPAISDLQKLVSETIESIRSAPVEKSAKALKTRLLADVTYEVREFLKSYLPSLSPREFTGQFVLDTVVLGAGAVESMSSLLLQAMKIATLQGLCKNNDVKPATVTEWRTLSAWAVILVAQANAESHTAKLELQRQKWIEESDCVVDSPLVKRAMEWVDKAKVLATQFSVLSESRLDFNPSVPSVVVEQLKSGNATLFARAHFVKSDLPALIQSATDIVYKNPSLVDLFSLSRSDLDAAVQAGQDLIQQLVSAVLSPIPTSTPVDETAAPDVTSITSSVSGILEFAVFIHEEGLCSKEAESEQETKEGSTEWCDGTGLGDGSGVNDKSDEIEDAGQFDTDRAENKEDKNEEDKEESNEKDGVEANADQGMNEDDVEEKDVERKDDGEEEDDDMDREMGEVDLDKDKGGEVDDSGAPEDDEDDEDQPDAGDEVDLKNQKREDGQDDTRANEGKQQDDKDGKEGEEGDEGEGDDGEEDEDEGEEVEGEKHEAFIDPKDQPGSDDAGDADEADDADELNDIESFGSDDDEEAAGDEQTEETLGDVEQDEDMDDGEDSNELDAEVDTGKPEANEENTEEESHAVGDNIDSSAGQGASEETQSDVKNSNEQSNRQESKASAPSDGPQSQSGEASANIDSSGADRTSKPTPQKSTEKPSTRPAPSPLEPNSAEALDEWLKEIKEVVERRKDGLDDNENASGDVGEKHDDSAKTAMAPTTEAQSGLVNGEDDDDKGVGESEGKDEDVDQKMEDGVDRDNVVMADADDALTGEEDVAGEENPEDVTEKVEEAEKKKRVQSIRICPPDIADAESHKIPESHSDHLPPTVAQPITPTNHVDDDVSESVICENEHRASKLASELSEKLLAVLEPTKRGRLEGFFKTGKRVSMRRVLSWIASDYRRDKFWLRRTKPSHRDYKVVICLDNTLSMKNNGVGELSLVCVSAISQSLQLLEVGKVGVMSFGTQVKEICPLEEAQGSVSTVRELMKDFHFNEESTNSFSDAFPQVIHNCSEAFKHSEGADSTGGSLALIITDGRFDKERCRPYVQELISQGHVPVLIVMDANKEESILSVTSVHFEEDTTSATKRRKIVKKPFLSQVDCPFPFYAVIQEPAQLPTTLADILRQWIEITSK